MGYLLKPDKIKAVIFILKTGPDIVIISCYCCRQAQQPVLFCKHSSDPEKSVQYLCNIIVITQIVCTFLLNGGITKTNQPAPRLCYCFHYTHLGPLCPLSRGQDFFWNLQGTWSEAFLVLYLFLLNTPQYTTLW